MKTTLAPILRALGERPTGEQILSLKICDPAMGSGAFLVETCRQPDGSVRIPEALAPYMRGAEVIPSP